MAILPIHTEGDPCLRQKATKIDKVTKSLVKLSRDMLETMYESKGVGLAAPQIGIGKQIVVIDVGEGPVVLFNPIILEQEGRNKDVEGCLSIPGRNEYITRAASVVVTGLDNKGKEIKIKGSGLLARALQHEIDHLYGILFIDYLKSEGVENQE